MNPRLPARHRVDRETELALIARLVSEPGPTRIVLIQAESGVGKSELLREARARKPRGVEVVPLDFKVGHMGLAEVLFHICDTLGWPRFTDLTRAIQDILQPAGVNVSKNTVIGHLEINVALSAPDAETQAVRRLKLTTALMADLRAIGAVLVIVDTYEQCESAVQDWLAGVFLPAASRSEHLTVVVSGQVVPDFNNMWEAEPILLGAIEPEFWLDYARAIGSKMSLDAIREHCLTYKGNSLAIAQAIESELRGARGTDLEVRLQAATDLDERKWLLTESYIRSLPDDLQAMVWAAAVPHWFNAEILAALRPDVADEAPALYGFLQALLFVEPYGDRGHNLHAVTRRELLKQLWTTRREEYQALSASAAEYYRLAALARAQAVDEHPQVADAMPTHGADPEYQVEFIYHLLISHPERGTEAVKAQGFMWHDEFDYDSPSLGALAAIVQEHADLYTAPLVAQHWGLFWEGVAAASAYRYHDAQARFVALIGEASDPLLRALVREKSGDVHRALSELPEARARYAEALPLFRAIGERVGEANCIQSLGHVHRALSELPEARVRFEEALPLYRAIGERLGEANCIMSLGEVHGALSELPQARARYAEALPLYRAIGARVGEANCIMSLGHVHVRLSELPEARARYAEALPLFRAIGARVGEATCIMSLGDVHVRLSELPEARARYAEALPLYRAIGARLGEANCIRSLGDVHRDLSELPEARARYAEALPLYHAIGARLGEANCIMSLGEVATAEKDYPTALAHFEDAASRFRAIGVPAAEAGAINDLANLYDAQRDHLKAIEAYTRALALPTDFKGYILRNRAHQYLILNDIEHAALDLEAAARLQPVNADLSLRRGELALLRGDGAGAIAHFEVALTLYPRFNDASFGIGKAHLKAGRITDALDAYRQGLAVTEAPSGLDDASYALERLQREPDAPAGIAEVVRLLEEWCEAKRALKSNNR